MLPKYSLQKLPCVCGEGNPEQGSELGKYFEKYVLQNVQCLSTFYTAYLSREKKSALKNSLYETTLTINKIVHRSFI